MTPMEVTSVIGASLAVAGAMVGVTYRFSTELKKISEDAELKRGRIFERLDENKRFIDDHFTRKDVCQILHKQIDEKLTSIDNKLDTLINNEKK